MAKRDVPIALAENRAQDTQTERLLNPLNQDNNKGMFEGKKLIPLRVGRSKSAESTKTARPNASTKMGKENTDSILRNGDWNAVGTFSQPKGYTFHNHGNTCYIGAALHLLRMTELQFSLSTDFHKNVHELLKESIRFDQSHWSVYGADKLQDSTERGTQQDSAEFLHKLIDVLGLSPSFTGTQASGQLSFDSNQNIKFDTYPAMPYSRLPITIEDWNSGNFESTIGKKDDSSFKVDMQIPGKGPDFLFITLNRFNAKNIKIKTRALTPGILTFGGENYGRLGPLHHGGLQTDTGHYWASEYCSTSGNEYVYNDSTIYKQTVMRDSTSVYGITYKKCKLSEMPSAKFCFTTAAVFPEPAPPIIATDITSKKSAIIEPGKLANSATPETGENDETMKSRKRRVAPSPSEDAELTIATLTPSSKVISQAKSSSAAPKTVRKEVLQQDSYLTDDFVVDDQELIFFPKIRLYGKLSKLSTDEREELAKVAKEKGYDTDLESLTVYCCSVCEAPVGQDEFGATHLTSYARNMLDHILKNHRRVTPMIRYAIFDTSVVCDISNLNSHSTLTKMAVSDFNKKMKLLLRVQDLSNEMGETNFMMRMQPLKFDDLIKANWKMQTYFPASVFTTLAGRKTSLILYFLAHSAIIARKTH